MKLLIEAGIFPENEIKLKAACRSLQIDFAFWNSKNGFPPYDERDNKVFFYGSLLTASRLKRAGYRYQVWLSEAFDYNYFGGHLHNYLLNKDYFIVPYGAFKSSYPPYLGEDSFIRSNSGMKVVAGDVFTNPKFLQCYPNLDLQELIVVAHKKKIEKEYRLIISATDEEFNDETGPFFKIVSSTIYDGSDSEIVPKEVIEKTNHILTRNKRYHPYPMWVMDVTLLENELKIIECNSLNCSGLYNSNIEEILKEIDRVCKIDVL